MSVTGAAATLSSATRVKAMLRSISANLAALDIRPNLVPRRLFPSELCSSHRYGVIMIARLPSLHVPDEVLERILDGGVALDGLSHLVAMTSGFPGPVLFATVFCPLDNIRRAA